VTAISSGFKKLLREPAYCEIASLMPDGSPIIHQGWVDTDGEHVLVNTREHSVKVRNVRRDPRVAVNVFDPANQWRLASVRGTVLDITFEGADEDIDRLAKKYRGLDEYPNKDPNDRRVRMKIAPQQIREVGLDGG